MPRTSARSAPRVRARRSRTGRRLLASSVAVLAVSLAAATSALAQPTGPPPVTILTSSPFVGNEDFFIAPTGDTTTYENGPEILSPDGNVVWFHPSRRT